VTVCYLKIDCCEIRNYLHRRNSSFYKFVLISIVNTVCKPFITVVSKRTNVSHHHHDHHTHHSTSYYVTFQVDSGDRMELHMSGQEYGMLVEEDKGNLTFQGTRYLGFERI